MAELSELREIILSDPVTKDVPFDEVILDRFLVANKGHAKKAFDQYKKTVVWRAETIDSKGDFFKSTVPVYNEYFGTRCLQAFHGVDKLGRPIVIERTGHIPYDDMLVDVPNENLFDRHIWQMEELNSRCKYLSKKSGKDIHQFLLILDLKDFKIQMSKHKLNMFKVVLGIDANYYPETLGQIFLLNAPSLFRTLWAMVQNFVDKKTRNKIRFLSESEYSEMLSVIDPDQLPVEYGGTCHHCRPGYNCVPQSSEPYIMSRMNVDGVITQDHSCVGETSVEPEPARSDLPKAELRMADESHSHDHEGVPAIDGVNLLNPQKLRGVPPGVVAGNSWEIRRREIKSAL